MCDRATCRLQPPPEYTRAGLKETLVDVDAVQYKDDVDGVLILIYPGSSFPRNQARGH